VPDELLQHLSPLAGEHIILTGEHRWGSDETCHRVSAASYDQHADVPMPGRPPAYRTNSRKDVVTRTSQNVSWDARASSTAVSDS